MCCYDTKIIYIFMNGQKSFTCAIYNVTMKLKYLMLLHCEFLSTFLLFKEIYSLELAGKCVMTFLHHQALTLFYALYQIKGSDTSSITSLYSLFSYPFVLSIFECAYITAAFTDSVTS